MNAVVDIVMTAYNAGAFLPETLGAMRAQTFSDYRLIIVDDGSTDETPRILAEAAADDPRIEVITQKNAGIVAASNVGLELCNAVYIARQDADDIPDPTRLERQVAYLEQHPDCVATGPLARHIDEHGTVRQNYTTNKRDTALANPYWIPAREPYLMHPFLMVRASAFHQTGGYRPMLGSEDSDLYWRLSEIGRLYNMPETLGSYRIHSGSISSNSIGHGARLAFCAQLAAISAQRRREGRKDLEFTDELMQAVKREESVRGLFALGCQFVEGQERDWLEISLAAKIIEICFCRPFEPTPDDARFMAQAFGRHWGLMSAENAKILRESIMTTAVRLAIKPGYRQQGFILVGKGAWPKLLGRAAFRTLLPTTLRDRIKKTVKGPAPA
ncbi:glycosyltransferase family 2 protein [Kozakia baliensis]|uniref:glycosyltransferase family 2 protein n=1 Tax=Kozakia baliensis TaxID=153496 RepID=UPI00087B6C70|nr:glycosyltransferase family A protein [Kozakia baliensis]AOX20040.1 hypothetical protein A0U90_06740 [Kozakia baliensis]